MAKMLIKNGQNGCFLKMLWPKSQNVLTMVISVFIRVSNYSEGSIFFAEKMWFCQRSNFFPKTAISAVELKITCYNLSYLNKT